jgi:hypothetical protein
MERVEHDWCCPMSLTRWRGSLAAMVEKSIDRAQHSASTAAQLPLTEIHPVPVPPILLSSIPHTAQTQRDVLSCLKRQQSTRERAPQARPPLLVLLSLSSPSLLVSRHNWTGAVDRDWSILAGASQNSLADLLFSSLLISFHFTWPCSVQSARTEDGNGFVRHASLNSQ